VSYKKVPVLELFKEEKKVETTQAKAQNIASELSKEKLLQHYEDSKKLEASIRRRLKESLVYMIPGSGSETFQRLTGMANGYNQTLGYELDNSSTHSLKGPQFSAECHEVIESSLAVSARLAASSKNNPLLQKIEPGEAGFGVFDPEWMIRKNMEEEYTLEHRIDFGEKPISKDSDLAKSYLKKWLPTQTPEAYTYYQDSLGTLLKQVETIGSTMDCKEYRNPGSTKDFKRLKLIDEDVNVEDILGTDLKFRNSNLHK